MHSLLVKTRFPLLQKKVPMIDGYSYFETRQPLHLNILDTLRRFKLHCQQAFNEYIQKKHESKTFQTRCKGVQTGNNLQRKNVVYIVCRSYRVVLLPSDIRDAAAAATVGTTPVETPGLDKCRSLTRQKKIKGFR